MAGSERADLTEDWFEVTNFGDEAWIAANDGDLYFDDVSMDPAEAVLMSGISEIAPGQSDVFVDEDASTVFLKIWEPAKGNIRAGDCAGSGLSQDGDGVTFWVGDPNAGGTLADFQTFPDANAHNAQSYDVPLGAFSVVGNASEAVETLVKGGDFATDAAVGSPGMAVPEPCGMTLLLLGLLGRGRRI